jgi:hypothetical protein
MIGSAALSLDIKPPPPFPPTNIPWIHTHTNCELNPVIYSIAFLVTLPVKLIRMNRDQIYIQLNSQQTLLYPSHWFPH